jgi:LacI family transcriptional regulator
MAKGGRKSITIRDVAHAAGVSVGTVSRSVNAPQTVRPATLAKVRASISSLGFQPDSRAQNMRRRNTMTIGFVVDDIGNPWHASSFKAADSVLRERGYSLYLVNTNGRPVDEASAVDMLQHGRADGLIMTINNERDTLTLKRLEQLRIPSVLLDRDLPLEIDAVLTDHASGIMQATNYLMELGHLRIAIITAGNDIRPGRERVRGFVEAYTQRGLEVPTSLIRSQSLSAEFGFREATDLLGDANRPTAIIAAGNRILVGVLRAFQQRGISVPGDISLIGCDRSDVAMLYPGPITIIDRDVDEIGRTAAQLLLERLERHPDRAAQRIQFPTRLILGGSCSSVKK